MENKEKKVRFALANTPTQDREKNKKKYRKLQRAQTGKGLTGNLSNLLQNMGKSAPKHGINMGSKTINYVLGKKIADKGIENIPNLF